MPKNIKQEIEDMTKYIVSLLSGELSPIETMQLSAIGNARKELRSRYVS